MNIAKDVEQLKIIIYIPIWSYYYVKVSQYNTLPAAFTFQYGATTMKMILKKEIILYIFTFQYGATTMRPLLNSDFLIIYPLFLSISIFCKFYRYFQIKYLDLFNP